MRDEAAKLSIKSWRSIAPASKSIMAENRFASYGNISFTSRPLARFGDHRLVVSFAKTIAFLLSIVLAHSHAAELAKPNLVLFLSDDHGVTWQLGGIEDEKTNESTLVELADGSLLHNMRSYHKKNRRAVATSKDGGRTWSPVKLDDALLEPVCQASILRCTWPENGERSRILFSNPASTKREKLTVRMSYDEGVTWPIGKLVFPGPAAYSCLVMLPDKSIGCLFECGKTNSYESITLARISQDWLEQKAAE